ncbi:MAG: glycosyltransferase family 2 protein [Nanoarchaeota archaeon]|nr:glycosyltransferase family 2 protein [Nanoarchaeota archaeon]
MNFLIIATGFNCARYVAPCANSFISQTYHKWRAILVDDGSTDHTYSELKKINHELIEVQRFEDNLGACKRRFDAINGSGADEETVIILVGLDDQLLSRALLNIKYNYEIRGAWMSYGNWRNQNGIGLPPDFALHFDPETHASRNYRRVKYRSTAPNTFKKFLFDQIPESDFKMDDGRWFDTTTESELMISCLEMCGESRIAVIIKPLYIYNEGLRNGSLKRLGIAYKRSVYKQVMNRPKKQKLIR